MSSGSEAGPGPAVSRGWPRASMLVALAAAALLVPYASYLTDDSYIHFQFAKHLIRGEGFAFNAGQPTYGATSPLWVLLLAAVGHLVPGAGATPAAVAGMPPLAWISKVLGGLATVFAVLGLIRLGRRLGWRESESLALGAFLAFHAWSARWGVSGMETPVAVLLVVLALDRLAATLVDGAPAAWPAGAMIALAAMARPEALLLGVLACGALAAAGRGPAAVRDPGATPALRAPRMRPFLAGFIAVYGAWLITASVLFDRLLPNTSAAKAGAWMDLALGLDALRDSLRSMLAAEAVPIALAVMALAFGAGEAWSRLPSGRRAFWLVTAIWPIALIASFALTGVQVVSRYLLVLTPAVLLLGVASLRWFTAAPSRARRAGTWLLAAVALHAAINLVVTFRVSAPAARAHAAGLKTSLASIGVWAREHTPPATLFAVADIGAFGYYSDRPVLDLYGLVTPVMAPLTVREGYDRVVFDLGYEPVGRPAYLVDRARTAARLTVAPEPDNPYRFIFSRAIPNLGITRPGEWAYSVYAIDWGTWDRLHPKLATVARKSSRELREVAPPG